MTSQDFAQSGMNTPNGLLPIREVTRQTGVNPVTLRAWERRYGLIKPQRTPKGHRLYSAEQIAQIREVLGWLQRGVAVSQVKRLLQESLPPSAPADSPWLEQQRQWLRYIEQLAERQLDEGLNQALALYPPETLCPHLFMPLLDQLELRWRAQSKTRVEQVFFLSWLRNKLSARVAQSNRQQSGPPLLMLNLSERNIEPGLWLSAWLASNADCPVRVFEWPIPAEDLALAVKHIGPRAVLLYADQRLEPGYLRSLLNVVDLPQMLCGRAVSIHHETLVALPDLHLADNPIAALHALQQLGLLDGR